MPFYQFTISTDSVSARKKADIARAMGCKQGTVKSTLHAALKSLRVELDDSEGGL